MNRHYVEGDELRAPSWIAIRTILMEHWDPIGVCDEQGAADEYESYIPKARALIRSGASEEDLIAYLDEIESKRMGFESRPERGRVAARLLVAMRATLEPL